jgi:hypothetical protein
MKTNEPLAWLACLAVLCSLPILAAEDTALGTAVVKEGRVNVRGQPSLVGEVITQLKKGEKVVVLEEVAATKPKTNEPPKWARIQMPANTPVWVSATLIDPATKSVKVSRLNLRAGPGENYSVVGRLPRGTPVTEIRRVEDWMEIETPPGAYAFVAADLLTKPEPGASPMVAKQEPVKTPPVVTPPPELPKPQPAPEPANNPVVATQAPVVVTPPTVTPPVQNPEPTVPAPAEKPIARTTVQPAPPPVTRPAPTAPATAATAASPKPEETFVRRVVRREGLVRSTASIQAPTYYELLNPENRKTINYLHNAENLGINLKDYRGRRIVVTGEEAIDPRWPKTPVIEVETLELIP